MISCDPLERLAATDRLHGDLDLGAMGAAVAQLLLFKKASLTEKASPTVGAPSQGRCPDSQVNDGPCPENQDHLKDTHRYRAVDGVQILATPRTMGLHALRLEGMTSIAEGIAAVAHDIRAILRLLGWREAAAATG